MTPLELCIRVLHVEHMPETEHHLWASIHMENRRTQSAAVGNLHNLLNRQIAYPNYAQVDQKEPLPMWKYRSLFYLENVYPCRHDHAGSGRLILDGESAHVLWDGHGVVSIEPDYEDVAARSTHVYNPEFTTVGYPFLIGEPDPGTGPES